VTLKCKKISGIEKSVCVAEQKIAYNYAFMYVDCGKRIIEADIAGINKADGFYQIERIVLNSIKSKKEMQKYNIDAIIIAFRNGFEKYCKKSFIANDYKAIGECFNIPYTVI
jgi:hypothetical protein